MREPANYFNYQVPLRRSNVLRAEGAYFHRAEAPPFEELRFEHWDTRHVVFAVFSGSTRGSIGRTGAGEVCNRRDRPGAITFVPGGHAHQSLLQQGRFSSGFLALDPEFMPLACEAKQDFGRWRPVYNVRHHHLFSQMQAFDQAAASRRISRCTLDGMSLAIARTVAEAFGSFERRNDDAWFRPSKLRRTLEYIDERLLDDPCLADLARAAGLSVSAFTRAFRGTLGVTPSRYLLRRRLARAKDRLEHTDQSIAQIAADHGFADSAHFCNSFRLVYEQAPSAFRKNRAKQ